MAIIIEKANIKNTDIEISGVYARLSFAAMPNGNSASANLNFYTSKASYDLNKHINVDVPYSFNVSLDSDENQDLKVIHEKVVAELESKGFKASSDLTEELV